MSKTKAKSSETAKKNRQQLAALCWRMEKGEPQVLLITSRGTGRWVVPKGWPMEGRSPWDAAAIEAWEEAGVKGCIDNQPLGQFNYDKYLNRSRSKFRNCDVDVYPLRVDMLSEDFPESKERHRQWFSLAEAAQHVDEPGLQELLSNFACARAEGQAIEDAAKT